MKIIDAYWEKRNLNLTSKEIHVELNDSREDVIAALESIYGEYIVVSLPIGRKDLYDLMVTYQYSFVEAAFQLEMNVGQFQLDSRYRDIAMHLSCLANSKNARERVEQEIQIGMYTTDRVSIDPFFQKNDTINRYIGFLSDELARGAEIWEFMYDTIPIGYTCTRKVNETTYHQSLVGMYQQSRGKGLGFAFAYLQAKELMARGVSILSTVVSSNNMASMHVHTKNGFVPVGTKYIFVKHTNIEERLGG